jgi:hypothetical protein
MPWLVELDVLKPLKRGRPRLRTGESKLFIWKSEQYLKVSSVCGGAS